MLYSPMSVNQSSHHQRQDAYLALIMPEVRKLTEGD